LYHHVSCTYPRPKYACSSPAAVLDVEIAALDPNNAISGGIIMLKRRTDVMIEQGAISSDDEAPQRLLSQGKYIELKKYLDDAESQFRKGGR
jgi:hypothetical protein